MYGGRKEDTFGKQTLGMEPVAHVNTLYMVVLYLIIHPPKDSFIIISHLLLRAVLGLDKIPQL